MLLIAKNNIVETLSQIESRITKLRDGGSKFSTERMINFARALKNPENAFKIVHIAGTNGKGSTCAFVESILRAHGFKTGLFTSPHLLRINERVQVNRNNISDEDFISTFEKLESIALKISAETPELAPTFFEYIAALALEHFKDEKIDFSILEVGLGGRLDATNIVSPQVCAITSIGFDHMQYLGDTLEEIAAEKAGIIKHGVPIVCGILPNCAMHVIEKIAKEKSAPLFKLEDYFTASPYFDTNLLGFYQKKNAALAFLICKILIQNEALNFDEAAARDALLNTSWDARWQKFTLSNKATLMLDCSHNAEGALELEKNLIELIANNGGKKPKIATGILGKERAIPLLKVIAKYACQIIFLKPDEARALSFEELRECMPEQYPKIINSNLDELLPSKNFCACAKENETIVFTGSCYLAGEVLSRLTSSGRDNLQDKLPSAK